MTIPGALLSDEFLADVRIISNDMAVRDPSRAFRFLEAVEDSGELALSGFAQIL